MAKLNAKDFIASLNEMSLLEVNELVQAMQEEYGFDLTAVAAAPAGGDAAGAEAQADAPVTVTLTDAGAAKVNVIKVVREITGLGLIESKAIVDSNGNVKENISKAEADEIKAKLEEAGASVEVK